MFKLGDVVGAELVGLGQRCRMPVGVKVDQRGEGAFVQPAGLDRRVRRAQDRSRSDYQITAADSFLRRLRHGDGETVLILHIVGELEGIGQAVVVGDHPLQREQHAQCFQIAAALNAAAQYAQRLRFGSRQVLGSQRAGCARAFGSDPGAVHHCQRQTGVGVVEYQQAADVGQAAVLVLGIAADPLDADAVQRGDVGRHGVDERIGS